ncbi:uncharacterized protein SPPG_00200 [Spizellomyces punctatus DAOM BR117]|uniref:MORN repeat-containing protein 3 n=1 Tax=Spizellomyces punctatus (strain DAOM BR117) TaxID=645134 RepID=A0A0L0HTN5_SPIPD|nr:uncharacterized protein SPPG_00200 [Spizellomyces punctatus DAOM BR117]KND04473.1 hypothetical protein SPPG_00200 [Spizellomyces punctatus DAOM BR117]|eukprot:XP_016612512.1 hypothetical protein SPPG_00200 [Spizellomyces punctatus DAOM BR117]
MYTTEPTSLPPRTTIRTLSIARHADIVNTPHWRQKEVAALRNGIRATVYMTNGDRYVGEWKDGLKEGNGTYCYASTGAVYEGEWARDLRNGFGTYSVPALPQPVQGKTKKPLLPSLPTLKTPPRAQSTPGSHTGPLRKVYAGSWLDDLRHGRGTCFYEDGSVYDGMWEEDVREGWGRMTYKSSGSVYEGEWHEGMRHGQGVLVLANGDRYEGTFLNDMKEGPGRFIYRTKRQCYEGEWALDTPKCGTLRDLPPLAGPEGMGPNARKWWPIPELKLQDPAGILDHEREAVLQERLQRIMGESLEHDGEAG